MQLDNPLRAGAAVENNDTGCAPAIVELIEKDEVSQRTTQRESYAIGSSVRTDIKASRGGQPSAEPPAIENDFSCSIWLRRLIGKLASRSIVATPLLEIQNRFASSRNLRTLEDIGRTNAGISAHRAECAIPRQAPRP